MNAAPAIFAAHRQHGAALVVGLILLLVLTLLAVSGMNSASLEFIMAGNEQYHNNAFQAAEAGIEQSRAQAAWNPDPTIPDQPFAGATSATDNWTSVVQLQNGGAPGPPPAGYNVTTFGTYYFQITTNATSTRGANAAHVQGISKLSPR